MNFVADSGYTLGITAETGSGTIVVAVEGPVDSSVTGRIHDAVRPLAQVMPATVRVDLSAAQAAPDVAREIRRHFAAA